MNQKPQIKHSPSSARQARSCSAVVNAMAGGGLQSSEVGDESKKSFACWLAIDGGADSNIWHVRLQWKCQIWLW
uniref:Uncharacterized protein n=1 Tax=Fagus sylvatica TaxID=28930 RepID=A0A2N9GIV5_FAGSY